MIFENLVHFIAQHKFKDILIFTLECIVNKTPRKHMYKAELVRVALNILMTDVYPVIEALGIDQKKFRRYIRRVPLLDKGSFGLLLQLCEGKKRKKFCLILTKLGYIDVARSTYSG